MKFVVIIARVLLGLGFIIFGANILHPFLPMPAMDPNLPTTQFSMLMANSGWMKVIGLFQLIGGILVLVGRTAPLGLTILAGLLINILCFHIFLDNGSNLAPGIVFSVLELFLVYAYRDHFKGIFSTNAAPLLK
ncbi:MAG: DoxX family protein [Proteobacteria bacterium]|nr:MAG: DoxX family protein [Pseudomonadota bacterium]